MAAAAAGEDALMVSGPAEEAQITLQVFVESNHGPSIQQLVGQQRNLERVGPFHAESICQQNDMHVEFLGFEDETHDMSGIELGEQVEHLREDVNNLSVDAGPRPGPGPRGGGKPAAGRCKIEETG